MVTCDTATHASTCDTATCDTATCYTATHYTAGAGAWRVAVRVAERVAVPVAVCVAVPVAVHVPKAGAGRDDEGVGQESDTGLPAPYPPSLFLSLFLSVGQEFGVSVPGVSCVYTLRLFCLYVHLLCLLCLCVWCVSDTE